MSFVCENEYCYKNNKKYKCGKSKLIACEKKTMSQIHKTI